MKIKIERSQKKKILKKKKGRVVSVGKHRKMVLALWVLLIGSLSFAIYKNFTAINQHTTYEKVIVKEKIVNTSGIENFTKDFAKEYFSWKNNKEVIENRVDNLEQYLTEEGLTLSQDMVRADIPTSSEVQSVKILDVEKRSDDFVVSFLLNQKITEGKKSQQIFSAYRVIVFEDDKKNYIVTSLPTMIEKPEKAEYEAKQVKNNLEIDDKTMEEITEFLETFFSLYPTASKKELEYYVENKAVWPINNNLKFIELINPVFQKRGKEIQGEICVKYLNSETKVCSTFQYVFTLEKSKNWKIVSIK